MDYFREFVSPDGPIVIRRSAVAAVRPSPDTHAWRGREMKTVIHFNGNAWHVAEEYEDVRDWAFPKNAQD